MTDKQIRQAQQFFLDCFKEFEWMDDSTFIVSTEQYQKYCKAKGLQQEIRDAKTFEFLMEHFNRVTNEALSEFFNQEAL